MDIEKLKELKSVVEAKSCRTEIDDGEEYVYEIDDKELMWALEECSALIDEAIARQSATSEDVAEAIEWQVSLKDYHQNKWEKAEPEWQEEPGAQAQHNEMMKAIDLAITALQEYQPWIRVKERLPTEADADEKGMVLTYDILNKETFPYDLIKEWNVTHDNKITHWKPLPEPPKGE